MNISTVRSALERRAAEYMPLRTVRMRNERPIVSISFDDCPKSSVTTGARLLRERGVAGSFYLSQCFCNRSVDGLLYFGSEDLRSLVADGHELGCHTASHISVQCSTASDLLADLERNADFIAAKLGDQIFSTFSYPFGEIDLRSKVTLQRRFAACRSSFGGVNTISADLGALRAERLYSSNMTESKLKSLVTKTVQARGWLILYTHDVSDSPTPFGCTPQLMKAALDLAIGSGCEILSVKNALGAIAFAN